LAVHAVPTASFATQVPVAPGFLQKLDADSQSASDAHAVLHDVAFAQTKPPGHGDVVPLLHVPEPLQVLAAVSMPALHDAAPQVVPAAGNTQAPVALQSVAPHVPPIGLHDAAQQWVPVPATPQTPAEHWSFAVHAAPAPPLGTHVPAAPGFLQ
jgi:hypothetical protein